MVSLSDIEKNNLTEMMPNLFVIGASKAGSSALHKYLSFHPDICMSSEKEPCFFVNQLELKDAWPVMARKSCSHDWSAYLNLWGGCSNSKYRGEGSVYYSQEPHRSGVAKKIAEYCPDARIIYTVREPVSRAIGHYWQRYKEFQEVLPLDVALVENSIYRDTSDYTMQLKPYLKYFDRSQIYIVVAEELRSNRREVLKGIFEWLELPAYLYEESELKDRHVSSAFSRKEKYPMVAYVRNSYLWARFREILPRSFVNLLRDKATVSFEKTEVSEVVAREYLNKYFSNKNAEFEKILGREILSWKK